MHLSVHAARRSIERSIPIDVVRALHDYGSPSYSRGALSMRLDRVAFDFAADDLSPDRIRRLERYRFVFLIEKDGSVVTVVRSGRRHRKA